MKPWYESWFSDPLYLVVYAHRDAQDARSLVDLLQREALPPSRAGGRLRVLDACCGDGRHSLELARRGYDVVGFDLSRPLLASARRALAEAPERGLRLRYEKKDVRRFDYRGRFDAVLSLFTSFGYFDDDEENFALFDNAAASLRPGGVFVLDYLNDEALRASLVPRTEEERETSHGVVRIVQHRRIERDRVKKRIVVTTIAGGKVAREFEESVALYDLARLRKEARARGLVPHRVFGDSYGRRFEPHSSKRVILVARKDQAMRS